MDLPCTESGNKHVIIFQDMFTKWPMVFPVPDQKSVRIARLLCEEIVPLLESLKRSYLIEGLISCFISCWMCVLCLA